MDYPADLARDFETLLLVLLEIRKVHASGTLYDCTYHTMTLTYLHYQYRNREFHFARNHFHYEIPSSK